MNFSKLIVLATALLASACAKVIIPEYVNETQDIEFVVPEPGKISTAYIGEEMLIQGRKFETPGIVLHQDYHTKWIRNSGHRAFPFYFSAGEKLKKVAIYQGTPIYAGKSQGGMLTQSREQIGAPYGIGVDAAGHVKWVYATGGVISETQGRTVDHSKAQHVEVDVRNFKQELIYSGRNEKELFFTYREFSENMIRAAFQQEVRYELDETRIIGFKSLRIEVIKATNQDITYKIIQGFE